VASSTVSRRGFTRSLALAATATLLRPPGALDVDVHVPIRAVTRGRRHHWFGYYDKSPEDRSGRYVLAHASDFAGRQPMPGEAVEVG